jgi:hypothetical protein
VRPFYQAPFVTPQVAVLVAPISGGSCQCGAGGGSCNPLGCGASVSRNHSSRFLPPAGAAYRQGLVRNCVGRTLALCQVGCIGDDYISDDFDYRWLGAK